MSSNSSDGIEFYSLPKIDNVTLRINQYPIQLVPTGFPTGIKRLERQTDHSPYLRLVDNECILILRHHIRLRYYAQGRINWTFIPRSTCLKFTNYIIQDYTHTHTHTHTHTQKYHIIAVHSPIATVGLLRNTVIIRLHYALLQWKKRIAAQSLAAALPRTIGNKITRGRDSFETRGTPN
jgi:hypothetical protein